MRHNKEILIPNIKEFKIKLLSWAQQFEEVVWLDSNHRLQSHASYDAVLAIDAFTGIQTDALNGFKKLKEYQELTNDWIFGYLSYDLKNDIEPLSSKNFDGLYFPDLYFFQPKKLFLFKENKLAIKYLNCVLDDVDSDLDTISLFSTTVESEISNNIKIESRLTRDSYIEKVTTMLSHIQRGDIYEANFCQEFYAENTRINPLDIYEDLNTISEAPFATFLKIDSQYLLCASPERYLKKEGAKIISQPIKGTAKRLVDLQEDQKTATALSKDIKERSENIMIVDLVRNDLSRSAIKGSVKVDELCKVYTFEQVHQLISTVVSEVKENTHPVDVIRDTFPMGSMTGAPKVAAMKIIEKFEESKRGLYSGTVGYFTPENDFNFNVIIRSILYNASLSCTRFFIVI